MVHFNLDDVLNGTDIYDDLDDFLYNTNTDLEHQFILFHGGPDMVSEPKSNYSESNQNADFGQGFYATTIPSQAEDWAHRKAPREHNGIVSVFEYYENIEENHFGFDYTLEWLDFIKECRLNGRRYDEGEVIIGRVADDNIWTPVLNYIKGYATPDETLEILWERDMQSDMFDDQYCFTTNSGIIQSLVFLGAYYA